ncbi:hypothetical protein DUNSADRAFT_2586 [Dunaliella salina]|uniref:Encoded protein n=1 Tax=Dunaliella salina TaxID=3046 RepID=A0ABQ7FW91_DUNSA|nr:hypothetical protein DUNSADRAFT_2586 [Dunaliella salina]|eukprot:KAF5826597.1 hypothetical protein DUNSADRAFT_2586 [Dunaliella salina]
MLSAQGGPQSTSQTTFPVQGMPIPPPSGKVRKEHVVPISSKYGGLTMERLQSLFFLGPCPDMTPHPTNTQGASSKQKAAAGVAVAAGNPANGEQATQPVVSNPAYGELGTTGAAAPTMHEGVQGSAAVQGATAAAPEVDSQGQGHHRCVQDKGGGGQSSQPPPEAESQGQGYHRCGQDQGGGGHSSQPPLQPASHIMLAIADDDGSVSLMRLFSHIQPPFEGPEVLPDAMAGGEGIQDSDEDS